MPSLYSHLMRARALVATLVVLLLAGITGSGFLLPRYVELSVAAQLSSSPDVLFPLLDTPGEWAPWSPWTGSDSASAIVASAAVTSPTVSSTVAGPVSGVGARWTWRVDGERAQRGAQRGTLQITQSVPSVVLDFEVTIDDVRPSYGAIRLAPNADGTMVYWSQTADMGTGPFARWRGMRWPEHTRPTIEAALRRLDRYAATKPATSPILGREIPGLLEFVPRPE
jgi:hypothetical protein